MMAKPGAEHDIIAQQVEAALVMAKLGQIDAGEIRKESGCMNAPRNRLLTGRNIHAMPCADRKRGAASMLERGNALIVICKNLEFLTLMENMRCQDPGYPLHGPFDAKEGGQTYVSMLERFAENVNRFPHAIIYIATDAGAEMGLTGQRRVQFDMLCKRKADTLVMLGCNVISNKWMLADLLRCRGRTG